MNRAYDTFHEVLVTLFNEITDIEEKAVITSEFRDITNHDMHVIEAIGIHEPRNMSFVAGSLSVTVGTLTTAVNSLVKKGYVSRARSEEDRRVVLLSLTEKGEKAFVHHQQFHEKMVMALIDGLSREETNVLVKSLTNLREFFRNYR